MKQKQNGNSIHDTNPTDLGILAVAVRELKGFAPHVVPGKQAVLATCPVCIGEPGAVGSLRVAVVGTPKRLSWSCSLHNGGFNGVQYALDKHNDELKAEKVSKLRERLSWNSRAHNVVQYVEPKRGSDVAHTTREQDCTRSDRDQKALRCTRGGWKTQLSEKKGLHRNLSLRCRRCPNCKNSLKAGRIAQVIDKLTACSLCQSKKMRCAGGCAPVRMAALDSGPYENATRLLRRHKVPYASIPTLTGRVMLTRSARLGGDEIAGLAAVVAELVDEMPAGSKISESGDKAASGTACKAGKAGKAGKAASEWVDLVGSPKLNIGERAIIYARFGSHEVARQSKGVSSGNIVLWDVSHLKGDSLDALHLALGLKRKKEKNMLSANAES